jgi:hypothetical protein
MSANRSKPDIAVAPAESGNDPGTDRGRRKPGRLHELIGPYFKADQCVWPEGLGDRNVCGIAALGDQNAADPRNVVARIEGVPAAADIGLEPAGKFPAA